MPTAACERYDRSVSKSTGGPPTLGLDVQASLAVLGVAILPAAGRGAGLDPAWAIGGSVVLGLVVAMAMFVWLRRRWTGPLASIIETARSYGQQSLDRRASETHGGREARLVAASLNRALDRSAVRRGDSPESPAVLEPVIEAVRALGQGDLRETSTAIDAPFDRVGEALDTARRDLRDRTRALFRSSAATASAAGDLVPLGRALALAADTQRAALQRATEGVEDATRSVGRLHPRVRTAIDGVVAYGAEQHRRAGKVREQLLQASRHAAEARDATERSRALLAESGRLDRLFNRIAAAAKQDVDTNPAESMASAVGTAKAVQANLLRELESLHHDLDGLNAALTSLGQQAAPPPPVLPARMTEPLTELADEVVRVVELASAGTRVSGRAAAQMAQAIRAAGDALERITVAGSELAVAVTDVGIDDAFENGLIDRLRGMQVEIEQLGTGELSPAGAAMIAETAGAADAARARLAEMMRAVDAASAALRVG